MKTQILNIGKVLNKIEQQTINGGARQCDQYNYCYPGYCCSRSICRPIGAPGVICEAVIPRDDNGY